jgi:hypothetical protein
MKKYRRLSAHAKGEMENSIKKLLASAWAILIAKGKPRNHWRRYVLGAACSTIGIVGLSLAYLVLMPKSYSSEWAIILPGAGVESRVSVDRLGQAQSSARSPFSAKELSPRVNYKQIAVSAPVIGAAAKSLGLEYAAFGKPDVKLIDQTSIIKFRVSGTEPELAEAKAWALHEALKAKLDTLRADEIKRRNRAIRDSIGSVEDNLANARRKLLDLQQSSGLASIDQYNRLIGSITALRQDLAQAESKLAETRSAAAALSRQLGIDAEAHAICCCSAPTPSFASCGKVSPLQAPLMPRSLRASGRRIHALPTPCPRKNRSRVRLRTFWRCARRSASATSRRH